MKKFEVLQVDVFGNVNEAWEHNDYFKIGEIEIEDNLSDDEIIQILFDEEYLSEIGRKMCVIDNSISCEDFLEIINKETCCPVFQLRTQV